MKCQEVTGKPKAEVYLYSVLLVVTCDLAYRVNHSTRAFDNDVIQNEGYPRFHGYCPGTGSGQLAEKNLSFSPFSVLCLDSLLFSLLKGFPRVVFQSCLLWRTEKWHPRGKWSRGSKAPPRQGRAGRGSDTWQFCFELLCYFH